MGWPLIRMVCAQILPGQPNFLALVSGTAIVGAGELAIDIQIRHSVGKGISGLWIGN
jgi:hypothetical protein